MQFKETTESTQRAFKSVEIQVGKLAKEVAKFVATREENFVKVIMFFVKPLSLL